MRCNLTLRCVDCGKIKTFYGDSAQKIMVAIDKNKWRDFPTESGIAAHCPLCDAKLDDSYLGEPD